MAQAVTAVRGGRRGAQASGPVWDDNGSSMGAHLDSLERSAGMPATREVVDGTLARLRHQLARLEVPVPGIAMVAAASAVRDCGALVGNGDLTSLATTLRDRAESRAGSSTRSLAPLVAEVRRTVSWLNIWRALTTPARARSAHESMSHRLGIAQ